MLLDRDRSIDRRKVTEYLLDPDHPEGWSKAKFFLRRGFHSGDPDRLVDAILIHPDVNEIESTAKTPHGLAAIVTCKMVTPDGRNPCVRTVWLRDFGATTFRFVTAYPRQ